MPTASDSELPNGPTPRCKGCLVAAQGRILYGKFGYYFKCDPCGKNTNVNEPCPECRAQTRLRKQSTAFTLECATCGMTRPYHVNPS